MEISLRLILDELGLDVETSLPDGVNPRFNTVELYTKDGDLPSPGTLIVCLHSEALAAEKQGGIHYLCAQDEAATSRDKTQAPRGKTRTSRSETQAPRDKTQAPRDKTQTSRGETQAHRDEAVASRDGVVTDLDSEATAPESAETAPNMTAVPLDIGIPELFNRVSRIFAKITRWVLAMERSVAKHSGLQDLLDLSEPIFTNFITVQDSTFKLVARTTNIEPADFIMKRLVELGYHPQESMDLFRKHRRIEQFKTNTDVVVSNDRLTSKYDVVRKTFNLHGSLYLMVVMECNGKAATHSVVELFGILAEYIRAFTETEVAQEGGGGGIRALILDILNKGAGSQEEARIRAANCDHPFDGGFRLYVFSFYDDINVPIAHLANSLSLACREAIVLSRDSSVLMLERKKSKVSASCKLAESALSRANFQCGISNDFDSLWSIEVAYKQAIIAMDVFSGLKPRAKGGKSERFQFFSENLVYYIVSAGRNAEPEALENSFLTQPIKKLREYDALHKMKRAEILRLYLETERNAVAVSARIKMHRNTVLYHIEKVCDSLGVDLNDPDTRLQLMLGFMADDLGG